MSESQPRSYSLRITEKLPDSLKRYDRAHENRVGVRHPAIRNIRAKFFKAVFGNFIILQLVFFANFCYIFGSLYTENEHFHNVHFMYMDYDGGVIGQSVRSAYEKLQAKTFPTLVEVPPRGSTPDDGWLREQVCHNHYWATMWTEPGASDRLSAALAGGEAAANYDPADVLTFIWNEARYPTAADSAILSNFMSLSAGARVAYSAVNGSGAINTMNRSDPAAVGAYSNPWELQQINIRKTNQGARAIYNTLCIILILIQEFFYLAALNGMYASFKVYERLYPHRIFMFREFISIGYCFIGSLCVTGAIWIFRDGWDVTGGMFVLTWMIVWLFAHVNFLVLDAITVWVPMSFVPLLLITWIVMNVSSILLPFELVPGFYHWGYALPAHAVYSTQLDIWSGGCNPMLAVNLPVLFAWEVLGTILSALGVYRRCHYAVIAQESQEKQFNGKVQDALAFEKKRDTERAAERRREKEATAAGSAASSEPAEEEEARDKLELEEELRMEQTRDREEMRKVKSNVHFGPSFSNPFGDNNDS